MTREYTYRLKKEEFRMLIDMDEAAAFAGYRDEKPEGEIAETFERCAQALLMELSPAIRLCLVPLRVENDRLYAVFDDGELLLSGKAIRTHLKGCPEVLCVCVTLGDHVDIRMEQTEAESMLDALLFDALANAAVERLREYAQAYAARHFRTCRFGWVFGIGYGDLPLTLQNAFLAKMHAEEEIGLRCNEKQVLLPLKSVTGFAGMWPKENEAIAENETWHVKGCGRGECERCKLRETCPASEFRR